MNCERLFAAWNHDMKWGASMCGERGEFQRDGQASCKLCTTIHLMKILQKEMGMCSRMLVGA